LHLGRTRVAIACGEMPRESARRHPGPVVQATYGRRPVLQRRRAGVDEGFGEHAGPDQARRSVVSPKWAHAVILRVHQVGFWKPPLPRRYRRPTGSRCPSCFERHGVRRHP
jgi:hypothetical protein